MPSLLIERVQEHYTRHDIGQLIPRALAAAGKDSDRLWPDDLAPMDEFHVRGHTHYATGSRTATISRAC
jgi:hypothetical protein